MTTKKITLKILKPTRRYPLVGQEFETAVDVNGTPLDRFIRRRLADAALENNPVFEVVSGKSSKPKASKPAKPADKDIKDSKED